MNYQFHFTYHTDGMRKTADGSNADFELETVNTDNALRIRLIPKRAIEIISFYAEREYAFGENSRFFANGFQSWTDTREFKKNDKMAGLGTIGKSFFGKKLGMKYVGDYAFVTPEDEAGKFHSHGFAYVRNGKMLDFVGSLSDRNGYTIIYADMNQNTLRYVKDLEGIKIDKPYEILDLYFTKGEYDEVFDAYFSAMGVQPLTDEKIKGYTSWYNYYQDISETIILRDLASLSKYKEYVNTYQIDDGYETKVGDWLIVDEKKFPNGMNAMAEAIHAEGFKAGIWLAPFGAQKGSKIALEHPDWLIKDGKGKPLFVGHNWGGFYALDIYNEGARAYIKKVFNTVLNEWDFDMVKLDFLYAAAAVPMYGKTRGEIAYDAIDLLRECVGDKQILGCGVQQLPCFGKVEYMRIGPDMSLGWAHTFLRKNMHREDVSTPNAIYNSIYRRCLNRRAFLCDPDVFLLRRTNIKFTFEQQKTLAKFIKLFGSVLFMSDDVSEYDSEQLAVFKEILADDDTDMIAVNEENEKVFIDYVQNGESKVLKFNAADGTIF